MAEMNFNREKSPDRLDIRVKTITFSYWFIWLIVVLIIVGGTLWGCFGRVYIRVRGEGIILPSPTEIYSAVANTDGLVTNVRVKPGEIVKKGQIIAEIRESLLEKKILEKKKSLAWLEKERQMINDRIDKERKSLVRVKHEYLTSLAREEKNTLSYQIFMEKLLKAKQKLRKQGIITKMQLEKTQEEIFQAVSKLGMINSNRAKEDLDYLRSDFAWFQQVLDLDMKILNYKETIAEMELSCNQGKTVISPSDGRINQIMITIGQYLRKGQQAVTIVTMSKQEDALVFFEPFEGKRVKANMVSFVAPTYTKRDEYGMIPGKVLYVSDYPLDIRAVNAELRDPELTKMFSKKGPPIMARLKLVRDSSTKSGFKWTTKKGPPYKITNGSICNVFIVVKKKRPISMIVPFFRKWFLGE